MSGKKAKVERNGEKRRIRMPDGTVKLVKRDLYHAEAHNLERFDAMVPELDEQWCEEVLAAGWTPEAYAPGSYRATIGESATTLKGCGAYRRTSDRHEHRVAAMLEWWEGGAPRRLRMTTPKIGILSRDLPLAEAVWETRWDDENEDAESSILVYQNSISANEQMSKYAQLGREGGMLPAKSERETQRQGRGHSPHWEAQDTKRPQGQANECSPTIEVYTNSAPGAPGAPARALPRLVRGNSAPLLKSLREGLGIEALEALRGEPETGPHAIWALDTEYVDDETGRHVLSWQCVRLESHDGAPWLHEEVYFSLTGARIRWRELEELLVGSTGVTQDFRDFQCLYLPVRRDGTRADGSPESELTCVHLPAVHGESRDHARVKAEAERRIAVFLGAVETVPYHEVRAALLDLVPIPGDSPRWMYEHACVGTGVEEVEGEEREVPLTYRGLLRAEMAYDEVRQPDDGLEVKRRFRYRDVFGGRRGAGTSVGYTNSYEGVARTDGKPDPEKRTHLTVLCHFGDADFTTLDAGDFEKDILLYTHPIQGGLVTIEDVPLKVGTIEGPTTFINATLTLRDTMAYAPQGGKSLADLGETIHMPKIETDRAGSDDDAWLWKEHMDALFREHPVFALEYAVNDSRICLLYASIVHGLDCKLPVTTLSAAVRYAREGLMKELSTPTLEDFNLVYRGLARVESGKVVRDDGTVVPFKRWTPYSVESECVMTLCSSAYHGGLNACIYPGLVRGLTYDLDVQNAYPTAMAQVVDVDWSDPVERELVDCDLTLDDFNSEFGAMTPLFCEVDFIFPKACYFPCIAVDVDTSLVFPRTSEGVMRCVACGPDLWLALQLGARVHVRRGYLLRVLRRKDGSPSRSLAELVRLFVAARSLAKRSYGKGSLAELLLKLIINGLYGKTAQGVSPKRTYSALTEGMEDLEGSAITSPYHASMITAAVRALLCAVINEARGRGRQVFSVTTDGGITDFTAEELETWDLYGLAAPFHAARVRITGSDPTIFEPKHMQSILLNFSTRGNVGLVDSLEEADGVAVLMAELSEVDGLTDAQREKYAHLPCVLAHNSFVTGETKDSHEDYVAMFLTVLTRSGRCRTSKRQAPAFKLLASRRARRDFTFSERVRKLSMDFDCKRAPVSSSLSSVYYEYDGDDYEVATFDTRAWETVDEYLYARNVKSSLTRVEEDGSSGCLRTRAQWLAFLYKVDTPPNQRTRISVKDLPWSMLRHVLMLYRRGGVTIPALEAQDPSYVPGKRVSDVVEWANRYLPASSRAQGHMCTRDTWKNARRESRAVLATPEQLAPLIEAMQADDPETWLAVWD